MRRYHWILLVAMLLPATARAEGPGIRLGDKMLLHLGLGTELAWDSNVFYADSTPSVNNPSGPISSFELRLTPYVDLTNRTRGYERAIDFRFHAGMNYVEYLTSDASLARHRQFGADGSLQLALFPYLPYNVTFFDNYIRSTQPPYSNEPYNLDRDTNEVGTRVSLSPGGGRLTFLVGYLFGIDFFEIEQLKAFDLMYHRFDLRASWRFLPKTAVYIAASQGIYTYPHPDQTNPHPGSYPLRIDAGLQGLITTKLTLNVWAGYGNGFYVSGPSPNTAVGGLALSWKPTMLSTGTLFYSHDFQNSLLGSYYDMDSAGLSWTQLVWRFTGFIRFQYANQRFQGIPMSAASTTPRTDNVFTFNTRVDYPFRDWLIGSVGYDLSADVTNASVMTLAAGGLYPANYLKHVVYLRVTVAY